MSKKMIERRDLLGPEAVKLYEEGKTQKEVGLVLGVPSRTVSSWLKYFKVKIRKGTNTNFQLKKEKIFNKVINDYQENKITMQNICKTYHIDHYTLKKWLQEEGIPLDKSISTNSLDYGEAYFNQLLQRYKKGASKRNLEFYLNRDQFKQIIQKKCHYCHEEPILQENPIKPGTERLRYNGTIYSNTIDRKDSTLGYTLKNCVAACEMCNRMKMDLDYEVFIAWVNKISRFQNEK
ncbi:hypothetical protein A9Q84_00145 [Halobacteriovorax marinus]|uniref:Uncharacterized protein n=1 Tax=Halobacteriovorax marinus TaxID=97084 RepID=A0A1Y5FDF2_9BACT|nr:hypothetical protein A9Q84_00145 [Halobacteriovorax marinus]